MKKRLFATVAVLLVAMLTFAACGGNATEKSGESTESTSSSDASVDSGVSTEASESSEESSEAPVEIVDGTPASSDAIGKANTAKWFTFTVKSIALVPEYAGYTPADGMQLIDIVMMETNTFDQGIPMGTVDFFLDNDEFVDYIYPMDALNDTMMPAEFELLPGESVEYHIVYEVPAETTDFMLQYVEYDTDDVKGTTFTVDFTI